MTKCKAERAVVGSIGGPFVEGEDTRGGGQGGGGTEERKAGGEAREEKDMKRKGVKASLVLQPTSQPSAVKDGSRISSSSRSRSSRSSRSRHFGLY